MMDRSPIKLLTVNTSPKRAKLLIGRVVEALGPEYNIQHVDNCQSEHVACTFAPVDD